MKRTRLNRTGRKAKRDHESRVSFVRAVREHAQGSCQRCWLFVGSINIHPHHLLPRSLGGTNDPSNGVGLCFECHRGVHDHTVHDWSKWLWRSTSSLRS